jgi:pimeloyl-ACP methyl ester carboxylesterase
MKPLLSVIVFAFMSSLHAQTHLISKPAPKRWPAQITKVGIPCSDGATQEAMWFAPASTEKKPLLVGLHTWSSSYASAGGDAVYAEWCVAQGWAFVHPDFRGPNWTAPALGSDRAVQDVVEAVAWAKQQTQVDETRIYLIGVSGGGHMAMLMAGRHPEIWAGVSAWCGIDDIAQWHAEHTKNGVPDKYAQNIEAALGHAPTKGDPEAWKRSPLSCLKQAAAVPLDAFPLFYETQKLPPGWQPAPPDASYGVKVPIFRHISGNTRLTLFEGGHEIVHQAALNWLAKQRRGQPVVWDVRDFIPLDVEGESGK